MAPTAHDKTHGPCSSYHNQGKVMHVAFNHPTVCVLIEATSPGQGHAFYFRIDQAIPRPGTRVERQRVLNQVEAHLNYLHGRTGLNYHAIYWADPVRFTAYLKDNQIEVS